MATCSMPYSTESTRNTSRPTTQERAGQASPAPRLRQADFPERDLEPFITAACNWGGYAGIGRRILNRNSLPALRDGLREANELLDKQTPDVEGALTRLNRLHSLGSPSFASKHLRFLRPDICPVLDSVLRDALPRAGQLAAAQ
jgi:hypothetical protein